MSIYIGLDIGGTKTVVASSNAGGSVLKRVQFQTPASLEEGLSLLNDMIAAVCKRQMPVGIGAAIGGPLDFETGIVSPLHQPQWREVPLKKIMEDTWGCPFYVDVDTNIAALGEYYFGGEKGARILYLTLSTGMGGGFLIDGRVYRGKKAMHPEVGHQSINFRCSNPEGVSCECGAADCLEALVSGSGIRRIYGKPADKLKWEEWDEVAYNLGQGLRNLAAVYVPDVIIIGGGVALGGKKKFISKAETVMKEHLYMVPAPKVRLSRLGADSPLLGAIAAASRGLTIVK